MVIKVYVSDHCFSCKEAIQYFTEKEVNVKQINVTYNQEKFVEMLTLGGIATPLIVIDDQIFYTFERAKLDKVLEEKNE
ncbi:glutaredoxin family protein [Aneurinibacillus sp. Ricciae_BoGa-3]|uniref:glutaredoxin family protein n=1 Tax=Aneurinibacillus sp. Ricciae_BoGa-3 TaxID=3022697 RepID=UPI0023416710|nr:glutaredoxin family protein [Aneurinibacillus sp. Ricciae_BoGa-3]WCK52959.1 glutaredoxin family protein [Aneurinibacillus sp. Ricciae_BoGa-3]